MFNNTTSEQDQIIETFQKYNLSDLISIIKDLDFKLSTETNYIAILQDTILEQIDTIKSLEYQIQVLNDGE